MGILSGSEILRQINLGHIKIDPLIVENIGTNSVDVRLGEELLLIQDAVLDLKEAPGVVDRIQIPPGGFTLKKGVGYLGSTIECITTTHFVPWIDGRSTSGRYFLQTHQTAGRADCGFNGTITLELMSVHRDIWVYAGLAIAQVTFFTLDGDYVPYTGRYQHQQGPQLPKPLK